MARTDMGEGDEGVLVGKRNTVNPFLNWRFGAFKRSGDPSDSLDVRSDEHDGYEFDELVIGDGTDGFVHLEVMDDDHLWMDICGVRIDVMYGSRKVFVFDECDGGWTMRAPHP